MTSFEKRPWGSFKVLLDTPTYKVKEILVYPKSRLSLQSHQHREEFWVVVHGIAHAICGTQECVLHIGESIHIPLCAKHRLMNLSEEPLVIIEVQLGEHLSEDDIERFEDDYARVVK